MATACAQLGTQPPLGSTLSLLPRSLLPLICHYLPLRPLLLLSTVNRHTRGVLCPATTPPPGATPPVSLAVAADCWRSADTVRLLWGAKINPRGEPYQAALKVNGVAQHSLGSSIHASLASPAHQPQPTIAEAFEHVSLSPPVWNNSACAPPIAPQPIPYPLIPPLAALMHSLRFARRLELSMAIEEANLRVLLTILTVLPSFPLLHHFELHRGDTSMHDHLPHTGDAPSALVNGLFGCLVSLPRLSSLDISESLPITRGWSGHAEKRFACDALTQLLRERLLHAHLHSRLFAELVQLQAQTAHHRRLEEARRTKGERNAAAGVDHDRAQPIQYPRLQSLQLHGEPHSIQSGLLHVFPSLLLLDARIGCLRDDARDGSNRLCKANSSGSSGECSLRFLRTSITVNLPREMELLAQCHFLHSLRLFLIVHRSGTEPLQALRALAALTELRELTLELAPGSVRHDEYGLSLDEVFPLEWLDRLPDLRYLHIKACGHTSLATLRSLGFLPAAPRAQQPDVGPIPVLPAFVSRVEELGLDMYEGDVGPVFAGEFDFSAWTRLRRCAVRYMSLDINPVFGGATEDSSPQSEAANAVLRERVGADRWCTEAELVAGRLDMRWRREMAPRFAYLTGLVSQSSIAAMDIHAPA